MRKKFEDVRWRAVGRISVPESDKLMASHLIFQLILSVHLMLSDIEVVSGVVVHRLHEAENENVQDIVFQKNWGGGFKCQMCG